MSNPFERCLACGTDFSVGTKHQCTNIVPHPVKKITGIAEENLLENNPEIVGKWDFKEDPEMILATADDRIRNNVMRHEYKILSDEEKHAMKSIKDHALLFHEYLDALGGSRELAIAKTKLEEVAFWAVKHVTG